MRLNFFLYMYSTQRKHVEYYEISRSELWIFDNRKADVAQHQFRTVAQTQTENKQDNIV